VVLPSMSVNRNVTVPLGSVAILAPGADLTLADHLFRHDSVSPGSG
jgi:hypothetical protein